MTVAAVALLAAGPVRPDAGRRAERQRGLGATFARRSYRPGQVARLELRTPARPLRLRIFQAGPERRRTRRIDRMSGVARSAPITVTGAQRWLAVRLGVDLGPGLYFAEVTARDGRVGYAPFVVRPARLGSTGRVAVVLPTNTWQAYNFLDADGDGIGDTWYADDRIHAVDLRRPFYRNGVPPHYAAYDAGFLHWLAHSHHAAEVLSDDDLERVGSAATLRRAYDLIVFPGHEEYVTAHAFDLVAGFRNRGGNLAFLAANDFFYRVVRRGDRLLGRTSFRSLGRPEAALVGIGYVGWYENRYRNRPYVVVGARRAPWLFAGTGLRNGARFGRYGIEVDARAAASPRGVQVLARIPNVFGPGRSAEMSYYETARGARVFAAGTINFGGSAQLGIPSLLLENLWRRLSA